MGFNKKLKHFGHSIKKKKVWERNLRHGSEIGDVVGKGLVMAGGATGQPELVAAGGGVIGASKAAGKASKLLRKKKKKN